MNTPYQAVDSPYLVPYDGNFRIQDFRTEPPEDVAPKSTLKDELSACVKELDDLQRILYAHDRHSVLLVFQAMDAAGKDGTIRAVFSGVNPAGFQVHSFKQPSSEELDHDFLWRTSCRLPQRGRIGIFNRSYYEEVLVVRVHQHYLNYQNLPRRLINGDIWEQRLESIVDHEKHLARNGYLVLKFWLNVSRDEQKKRFLKRIDNPEKNWKFSEADVSERGHWDTYMAAYQDALTSTSRPWAPWYAIPADNKPYMRLRVAQIVCEALQGIGLRYPDVGDDKITEMKHLRKLLVND